MLTLLAHNCIFILYQDHPLHLPLLFACPAERQEIHGHNDIPRLTEPCLNEMATTCEHRHLHPQ